MSAVHHIAGRLRLKFLQLKNRPDLAGTAVAAIRQLEGVRLAQANTITGSVLIHYEAHGAREQALLASIKTIFRELGLELHSPSRWQNGLARPVGDANPIVDRLLDMVIEKAVERSAAALLYALL